MFSIYNHHTVMFIHPLGLNRLENLAKRQITSQLNPRLTSNCLFITSVRTHFRDKSPRQTNWYMHSHTHWYSHCIEYLRWICSFRLKSHFHNDVTALSPTLASKFHMALLCLFYTSCYCIWSIKSLNDYENEYLQMPNQWQNMKMFNLQW